MVTKDLGMVTAYAYAVAGGYTGTEAQFEQLMADLAIVVGDFDNFSVTVTTLPAGSSATASYSDGVLSLGIPKGDKGDKGNTGETGLTPHLTIGTVEATAQPSVTITGTVDDPVLNFGLVKGDKGDTGEVSLSELEQATVVQTLSDNAPYNFRRTNNGNGAGVREYDEIVGGTVAWNQLVSSGAVSVTIPSGHKYYALINSVASLGTSDGTAIAITDSTKDMVVDLTLMFGSTIADYIYSLEQNTEGAGVAFFRKLFPKPYYAYNAGELKSVSGLVSHDTVGFNAWDEEWEVGGIDITTGENTTSSTNIRGKNYCRCVPNTDYYMFVGTTGVGIRFYNADKSYVGYLTWNSVTNKKFTTPTDAYYFRVAGANAYGATYNHDICINLSSDRNGEYEEYVKHSYALDDSLTLRGIPKLDVNNKLYYDGDTYEADGTVTRKYGIVVIDGSDDETFNMTGYRCMVTIPENSSRWTNQSELEYKCVSDRFVETTNQVTYNGGVGFHLRTTGDNQLVFSLGSDSGMTTATQWRAWFASNPTTVVYELATPTTETATPYDSPQWCDSHGTEEYVGSELPVGHNTQYPMTLIDTADGLSSGTYEPRITIANGKKTVTWVSV